MRALSIDEIDVVSGGNSWISNNGQPFSWTGPNGVVYDDIVLVTNHYIQDSGGGREYFVDIFGGGEIPGFLAVSTNQLTLSQYFGTPLSRIY